MSNIPRGTEKQNWFSAGGENYAKFRPVYPEQLASYLTSVATGHNLAVDVGCGTGQLTTLLAAHFDRVIGIDPSEEQIANAVPADGVEYAHAPAESLPVEDHAVDLITAAQAAHWFDLPQFYDEVRRIAQPNAVIALVSYGVPHLGTESTDAVFQNFYWNVLGSFWPAERKIVDEGYRTIDFPFDELEQEPMNITQDHTLDGLLGYISTWSAVRAVEQAGNQHLLAEFASALAAAWGEPSRTIRTTWPINIRLGRVNSGS